MSDLHLEFRKSKPTYELVNEIIPWDERDKDSILVLAGDITPNRDQLVELYSQVCSRFPQVIHVAGNHEHYGKDTEEWGPHRDKCKAMFTNLSISYYSQAQALELDDAVIIFATLWTSCGDGDPIAELNIGRMNDFYVIKHRGLRMDTNVMKSFNRQGVREIEGFLSKFSDKKKIVVTHHLPSYMFCDPRYAGNGLDGLFASNHENLFEGPNKPLAWIFGHTHIPIEREVNGVQFFCNPLGYPKEHSGFNPRLFLDLKSL
jgi:predicted phosphodiesterase